MPIRLFFCLLVVCFALFPCALWCADRKITTVRSSNLSFYTDALKGFKKCFGNTAAIKDVVLPKNPDKRAAVIKEIGAEKPDLFLAFGTSATKKLRRNIKDVPVAFCVVVDPPSFGVTAPGVSMTVMPSMEIKFIRAAFPGIKRIGVLFSQGRNVSSVNELKKIQSKSPSEIVMIQVNSLDKLTGAMQELSKKADCLLMLADPVIYPAQAAAQLILQSLQLNLPIIANSAPYVKAGALAAVYADSVDNGCVASQVVKRIFNGESPASIPIQPSVKFKTSINMVVADRLKVKVNPSAISAAEEVIK